MEKVNFLPRGVSDVMIRADGSAKRVKAIYQGQEVFFAVTKLGRPLRCFLPGMKSFYIPATDLQQMRKQVYIIISKYEERAIKYQDVKKPAWGEDLERCGVMILPDGKLQTHHHFKGKIVIQKISNLDAAIRQQDHILENYRDKKTRLENGKTIIPAELSELLTKFFLVSPVIELRREILIRAKNQMLLTVEEALARTKRLMSSARNNPAKVSEIVEEIDKLAFFLENQWPIPYINQVKPTIRFMRQAVRNAKSSQPNPRIVVLFLFDAKNRLASLLPQKRHRDDWHMVGDIDPIMTLAQVCQLGLTDQVLVAARQRLAEPYYYKEQDLFRLNALLAISRLLIDGTAITSSEQILKMCT